jgi:SAM-dependent methyltransferase
MIDKVSLLARRVLHALADRIAAGVAARLLESGSFADSVAYRVALETLLTSASSRAPNSLFRGISDPFWFWVCTEGQRTHSVIRAILPGVPSESIQLNFTGSKGDAVLREGFSMYQLVKLLYESHVGQLKECRRLLDFGCGWGRIIRFFLKDVEPSALYGVDPVEDMVSLCKTANRWCAFEVSPRRPPSRFPDGHFDLIYAYSVFSHLSEEVHRDWLIELHRLLRPDGLLVVTTRGREFITRCEALRRDPHLQYYAKGIKVSAGAFQNIDESLGDYDSGRYCFSSHGLTDEWNYWGEAAISRAYVLSRWTEVFTFVDYIDDRTDQNVIVMKKSL